jgi:hypothetical protein
MTLLLLLNGEEPADTTAPNTTIDSGPAALTTETSATFTFSASEPGCTFQGRLDGGAWVTIVSPRTVPGLGPGEHLVEIRATDPSGNVDPTPATWSWEIVLEPAPDVALDHSGDRFLSAIAGPHESITRATLLDGGTETPLPTVVDGSVTLTANAATRGQCEVSLADDGTLGWIPTNSDSPLAPYGREIRLERGVIYHDGTEELYPLGVFRIEDASIDDTGDQLALAISGLDRSARIIDAKFEEPYQIAAGTNYRTAILTTAQAAWPDVPHDLATTDRTTPVLVADEGSDRWEFCQKMAAAIGMELYFNGLGVLTMRPVAQFVTGSPVWDISEGEQGVLVRVGLNWTRQGSFNRSIVTGENLGSTDTPARGVATDDNVLSPTYYYGPFGKVPEFFHSEFITTNEQAADVAAARLARQLGTTQQVSFGSVVNPRLEPSQVVRIARERAGVSQDHVLDSLTIPLGAEGEMSASTRATVVI